MAAKREGNPLCDGTLFVVQQEARRAERYVGNSNNDPDIAALIRATLTRRPKGPSCHNGRMRCGTANGRDATC